MRPRLLALVLCLAVPALGVTATGTAHAGSIYQVDVELSGPASQYYGTHDPVTLTAQVGVREFSAIDPRPYVPLTWDTGTVRFTLGTRVLANVLINGQGRATFRLSPASAPGAKTIVARYVPAPPQILEWILGDTGSHTVIVKQNISRTVVTSSSSTQKMGGTPATVYARVLISNQQRAPGSVQFVVGGTLKRTVELNSTGHAKYTLSPQQKAGATKVLVVYRPIVPAGHRTSHGSVYITVTR